MGPFSFTPAAAAALLVLALLLAVEVSLARFRDGRMESRTSLGKEAAAVSDPLRLLRWSKDHCAGMGMKRGKRSEGREEERDGC